MSESASDASAPADRLDPGLERLAADFIAAVERGDTDEIAERIYAPDAIIWHNSDGVEMTVAQNLATLAWLSATLRDMRYEEVVRMPARDGYVQRHVLRGHCPGGEEITVRACFFVTVAGGRITRIEEYLDTAASADVRRYRPESLTATNP
ncbi:nuclear transport factor 2 family protein [Nocardia spumae]|uniref:nuclear transport factor 2 family protein n=1 Tax=Nocardia spumae TaxID=2887190 RepID=UPI001D14F7AA|nr:nuclear transport factor 2 family protein [Nocardia spumae]